MQRIDVRAGRPAATGALTVSLVLSLLLAGCSNTEPAVNKEPLRGSASASMVRGVQQVTIKAGDDDRFDPSTITVHQGRVRIVLVHTGTGAPHDWALTRFPVDAVPLASTGQTRSAMFTTPSPGRYRFVCTIHERQGMVGTMVVLPGSPP